MLARLFRNISVQSLVRALAFSGAFSALLFLILPRVNNAFSLPWNELSIPPAFTAIFLILLLPLSALWFNSVINDLGFLKNDYQFIPVFSVFWLAVFVIRPSFELLILLPLAFLVVVRLFTLVHKIDPSLVLFDTGMVCGFMMLTEPLCVFFLLIIWLATINYGHMGFRAFLIPVVGIGAAFFISFTLLYWLTDVDFAELLAERVSEVVRSFGMIQVPLWYTLVPAALALLMALLETTQVYGKASVLKRQTFTFLTLFFFAGVSAAFFFKGGLVLLTWSVIPAACFVVNLIHYLKKKWHRDMVYLLLLGSLLLGLFL